MNLLFLHGFPFNGSSWEPQLAAFRKSHKVLAPDLRGMGKGPQENPPWFIHQFVEDVKELLDQNRIDKAVVCGLSMGGYIALHFAQKYPERLQALVLCDTQAGPDSNEAKDKRFLSAQKLRQQGLPAFAEEFSRNVLGESTLKEKPEIQKQVAAMIGGNCIESVAQLFGTLASRRDSIPFLPEIKVPALVVVGEQDKVTPPELSRAMAEKIPGAELAVISGAGHLSNLEQPEAFNRRLGDFLAKLQ